MKTLDQIWEENFDTIAPGEYTGSDCGNQIGGGAEPNEKSPLSTLSDKYKEIANDPALSNAAKEAKLEQLLQAFFKPQLSNGPIGNGPDPFYRLPNGGLPIGGGPGIPSTDPTSGPIPPAPGIPEPVEIPINLGGAIDVDIANDGTAKVNFRGITPTIADTIKAGLSAAMAAKNAACAKKKAGSNGNVNSQTGDTATPTPTSTTPLVKPAPTPVTPVVPFRPIPPIRTRPGAGSLSGGPVS